MVINSHAAVNALIDYFDEVAMTAALTELAASELPADLFRSLIPYVPPPPPKPPKPTKASVAKARTQMIKDVQNRWSGVTREELQGLYDQGRTSIEIAGQFGVSKVKVIQLANAYGIDRNAQLRTVAQ